MRVVCGEKKWTFTQAMQLETLLEKTKLKEERVLVMVEGRSVRAGEIIAGDSKVLIIKSANGDW